MLITFVDWDSVGDTIAGIEDDTGGTTGGVEGQDSLDGDVHGGCVEGFEHDLGHLLPVGLGVEGSLGQEDGVFLGCDTELVVEGVMPDLLHVVPVGNNAVLNGVLQGEDTSLGLSLISDVRVLKKNRHYLLRINHSGKKLNLVYFTIVKVFKTWSNFSQKVLL